MRKLLLLCTMLLSGIGAWAQITDVTQLSNEKCYHITSKDANRGAFYAADGASHLSHCGGTYGNYLNKDVEVDETSPAQQFALIKSPSHSDRYYLYSVSENDFAIKDGNFVKLETTPFDYITIVKNGDYFNIKIKGQNKLNFSGGYDYGVYANYETNDDGNNLVITEAAEFDPTIALARIMKYEGLLLQTGVGYPKETSSVYTTLEEAINDTDIDACKNALDAYYNTTDVEMPQDGKAYTVSAWWKTDGIWPMGWSEANSGTGDTNRKAVYKPLKDNANPSAFVCKYIDEKYVFISDNGYFLSWENEPATGQTSKEYKDAHKFTLEKAVKTGSNIADELTDLDMFGKFSLKANNNHYLMFSSADRDYHNANPGDKYYGHTKANTVFFVLEEVPDYKVNTVKLSAQFEDECISTFYAPYATVLPEGYTAHKATKVNTGTVHLEPIGTEIPANTGVFVTGPANEEVVLSLSTSNPTSPNDNLLDGSAVDTYVAGPAYVLANGDNGVGLYKAELNMNEAGVKVGVETGTHFKNNAGKAYLPVPEEPADACFLVFNFGDDVETGITETENENVKTENAEVYDLAGRRVQGAQKGIFIVNGKKVVR